MKKRQILFISVFLLPTGLLFLFIFGIPIAMVIVTSFTEWTIVKSPQFIGINNYIFLIVESAPFGSAIFNTILWMLIAGTLHVIVGIAVAIVLERRPVGWKAIRTIYFIPNILPGITLAYIFTLLLNPEIGLVNSIIRFIGFKNFYQNWFGDTNTAFIAVTSIWLFYAGLLTILVMAEYESIPESLFESARIDGASSLQIDVFITLPMLRNIIGTCVIISMLAMLKEFAFIWATTKGGPGYSTYNLSLYLYKLSANYHNFGLANTIGTIQISIGITVFFLISKLFKIGKSFIS